MNEEVQIVTDILKSACDRHAAGVLGERELICISMAVNDRLASLKGYEGFARIASQRLRDRIDELNRGEA